MNTTMYPIVSQEEAIDLFHTISYWRCKTKCEREVPPHHWYTTFDLVSKILTSLHIVPERRLATLRGNRDFFKRFLSRTKVVQQTDSREWATILSEERKLHFAVKISEMELTNGNRVNPKELFSLKKIFITARGVAAGPVVERAVARLIARDAYEKVWKEMTAVPIPGVAMATRNRRYAQWLKGDEEE